jgi:transposase
VIRLLGGADMAKPYSSDLRERVVDAVNEGATRSEAAERFSVGVSSAVRWHQAWRESSSMRHR